MKAPDNNQEPANAPWDPVFLESRREAWVILLLWAAALLWAVPYCYLNGFPETFVEEEFSTDDNAIEISDEDAESITNVRLAVDYLMEHGMADE